MMSEAESFNERLEAAAKNPQNVGEIADADAVGTVGSADCGDMLRMWVKFREENGQRVIDRASFQTFGCETAIAVASVATEMLRGKSVEQALALNGQDLSAPLGPLPPMKIHCAQLVEGALRNALAPETAKKPAPGPTSPTLFGQLSAGVSSEKKVRVILNSTSASTL